MRDEECGLILAERREGERRRIELAATPAGPAFEELGTRGGDDEEGNVRDPVDELV
jgi:hypothetical protein